MSFSKKQFERIKKGAAEEYGLKVVTRWRKGLKSIRFEDIVLREEEAIDGEEK